VKGIDISVTDTLHGRNIARGNHDVEDFLEIARETSGDAPSEAVGCGGGADIRGVRVKFTNQDTGRCGSVAHAAWGGRRSAMRVVRPGDSRFTLPAVEDVSTLPRKSLRTTLVALAALTAAVGAQLEDPTADELEDALTPAEAQTLLKLDTPRTLRDMPWRSARLEKKVGGAWRYSRRKLCAILRGDPV